MFTPYVTHNAQRLSLNFISTSISLLNSINEARRQYTGKCQTSVVVLMFLQFCSDEVYDYSWTDLNPTWVVITAQVVTWNTKQDVVTSHHILLIIPFEPHFHLLCKKAKEKFMRLSSESVSNRSSEYIWTFPSTLARCKWNS